MDWTYQCRAEIDEFEVGRSKTVLAELYGYPNAHLDHLSYDIDLLPTAAKYPVAVHRLSLSVTETPQDVFEETTADTSIAEFSATFEYEFQDYVVFYLYDDAGDRVGIGNANAEPLPDWLTESDERECYVVVRLEYDHELTKESKEWSDEEIEGRRERTREKVEKWTTEWF